MIDKTDRKDFWYLPRLYRLIHCKRLCDTDEGGQPHHTAPVSLKGAFQNDASRWLAKKIRSSAEDYRMDKLVFIDDDKRELDDFGPLIEGEYTCTLIHWPNDREKLFSGQPPDLFVSDLYLPPPDGHRKPTAEQTEEAVNTAREIAHRFHSLYAGGNQAVESIELCKARLRDTMTLITYAYEELLRRQWEALGQSPNNGIALLEQVRERFPEVPFIFYSRKISSEDAIKVLNAGAVDAIRKGVEVKELLGRLRDARRFSGRRRFLQS